MVTAYFITTSMWIENRNQHRKYTRLYFKYILLYQNTKQEIVSTTFVHKSLLLYDMCLTIIVCVLLYTIERVRNKNDLLWREL